MGTRGGSPEMGMESCSLSSNWGLGSEPTHPQRAQGMNSRIQRGNGGKTLLGRYHFSPGSCTMNVWPHFTCGFSHRKTCEGFLFFAIGVLCSFSPFQTLFCSTPTLFLAIMEIQHWLKTLKWSLKPFICFLFPLSCFMLTNLQQTIGFPWAVLKTLHLQPVGWLCTGFVSAVGSATAQQPWKKNESRRYSRTLRINLSLLLMAGLHNGENNPRSSLSLRRSMGMKSTPDKC